MMYVYLHLILSEVLRHYFVEIHYSLQTNAMSIYYNCTLCHLFNRTSIITLHCTCTITFNSHRNITPCENNPPPPSYLWLFIFPSTFSHNRHIHTFPTTSESTQPRLSNPEDGGSTFLWNVETNTYHMEYKAKIPPTGTCFYIHKIVLQITAQQKFCVLTKKYRYIVACQLANIYWCFSEACCLLAQSPSGPRNSLFFFLLWPSSMPKVTQVTYTWSKLK
jgi:hypothetical protein